MNYVIIVNDAGELKTITAEEFEENLGLKDFMEIQLNAILDAKAIAAGEYDPAENDAPMAVSRYREETPTEYAIIPDMEEMK